MNDRLPVGHQQATTNALEYDVRTSGYEGIPESLDDGMYLVTLTADEDIGEFGGSIEFARPVGVTTEKIEFERCHYQTISMTGLARRRWKPLGCS